jgi:hypothetical protein
MRTLKISGLEIRWTVNPSREEVIIVFLSQMDIDKVLYKTDALTGEILEIAAVKDRAFIKSCHAVLRRCGMMEKKTVIEKGLFKKEYNRRFFTPEFLREDHNS